jgi:hypothetical protein
MTVACGGDGAGSVTPSTATAAAAPLHSCSGWRGGVWQDARKGQALQASGMVEGHASPQSIQPTPIIQS